MLDEKKIIVVGEKFFYEGSLLLKAQTDIEKYLVLDDIIVILTAGHNLNIDQNIFGYSMNGKLKWQIPVPDQLHERNYYTSIYLSSANELQAYNQNGVEVTINKDDGSVIDKELIK